MVTRYNVRDIRFGGGHQVLMRDGLIPGETRWVVVWQGLTTAQANTLESFFTSRHGVTSFIWQPPGSSASLHFVCSEWQLTPSGQEYHTMEAQFRRVHLQGT